jgi:pimeloyl-ACP methyl ester carboxylesterase
MSILKNILLIFCLFFCGCSIYIGEKDFFKPIKDYKLDFEKYSVNTFDGKKLDAWYLRNPNAKVNIIFFYGNTTNKNDYNELITSIEQNISANIFCVDYRGYGLSEGTVSVENFIKDINTITDFFFKNLDNEFPTYTLGYSLGTFGALKSACDYDKIKGVFLIAPFSSADDDIQWEKKKRVPLLLRPFFKLKIEDTLYLFNNMTLVEKNNKPIFFIHGTKDITLPYYMSEELYKHSNSKNKKIVFVDNETHKLTTPFIERIAKELKEFVK